jgi:hypothetical protein
MYAEWMARNQAAAVQRIRETFPPVSDVEVDRYRAEREWQRNQRLAWVQSLVGRTIASVDANLQEYGDAFTMPVIVRFTDGTAVHINPDGYEVEGITLEEHPE